MACGTSWPGTHRFCGYCGSSRTGRSNARSRDGELVDVLRAFVSHQLADQLVDEGGRIPEQRRLVTALFADLSGFTSLAGQLDPEALSEVIDPLLDGLVRVVHRHEGYVGSFAGDALLAFFGAPVAHEDDAERALRTALDMLREFPLLRDGLGPAAAPLSLRIGVDTGHVLARLVAGDLRTDYSVLGDAVNMAQRMQSIAPVGACWVGEHTWRLTSAAFDLAPMGAVRVKGKDAPVAAWELQGELTPAVRRWRASGAAFVGRRRELELLASAIRAGHVAVVRGEAGAGKSRLLDELRSAPAVRWVTCGAAPYDSATSYRPWATVVRELSGLQHEGLDPQESDGLRVVLGQPPERPELVATPEARRRTAAVGMRALLRACGPVVVAFEDLHWADPASRELAEDVARDALVDGTRLVCTARPETEVVASLLKASGEQATVLELGPLGDDDVAALLADVLGGQPPEDLAREVGRRSGGNPLYVTELVGALLQRGALRQVESGAYAAVGDVRTLLDLVPATLEGLLAARVDALPYAAARMLTIAAVVGEPLRPDLLRAVAAATGGPTDGLDELVAEGLLVEQGSELSFVHALVSDAAYARTPRRRRRELHLASAEVAERVALRGEDTIGYLARHLYLGGAGPRAIAALQQAGDLATARGALAEAVVHLGREVELRRGVESDRAVLPDRLLLLGEHLEVLGRYAEAEPVLREASDLGADWRAQRAIAGVLRRSGRYADAVEVTEAAVADAPDDAAQARLLEERGWSLAATGAVPAALAVAQQALALEVDDQVRASIQLLSAYCLMRSGSGDRAVQDATDAAEVFAAAGDLPRQAKAHRLLGGALRALGAPEDAKRILSAGLSLAETCGAVEESASCLMELAAVHGEAAELGAALDLERRAIDNWDRLGHRFGQVMTRANHSYTLWCLGRVDEALIVAHDVVQRAQDADLSSAEAVALQTVALCLIARGQPDEAGAAAERSARLFVEADMRLDARDSWELAARAWADAGCESQAASAGREAATVTAATPEPARY